MLKKFIFVSIGIAAIVIFFSIRWTFRETDKSVGSVEPVAELSADSLVRLFETSEDSANQIYLGKVISVTGIVSNVEEDSISISVYLKNADDLSGVLCIFDKTITSTTSFFVGEETRIKGICSGYLFDVVMNKCAIAE